MIAGVNGITENTTKNILFGAGTIHKDLKFTKGTDGKEGTWNFTESCIGATSGGSKLSIVPEIYDVPVDGPVVLVKNLRKKIGEKASLEVNLIELSTDIIVAAAMAEKGTSDVTTHDMITSKADITDTDYWGNIAFVGKTLDGRDVIAILENALCTSGFEQEGKNKESGVGKYTFECHADPNTDMDKLPWKIYYPTAA
jgi:hypothetical protein